MNDFIILARTRIINIKWQQNGNSLKKLPAEQQVGRRCRNDVWTKRNKIERDFRLLFPYL